MATIRSMNALYVVKCFKVKMQPRNTKTRSTQCKLLNLKRSAFTGEKEIALRVIVAVLAM